MFIAEENELREILEIPKDRLYLLSRRKPGETLTQWADRCCVLQQEATSEEPTR